MQTSIIFSYVPKANWTLKESGKNPWDNSGRPILWFSKYCWLRPHYRGVWFILGSYCSIRTEQTSHMEWNDSLLKSLCLIFRKHVFIIWSCFTASEIFFYKRHSGYLQLDPLSIETSNFASSHFLSESSRGLPPSFWKSHISPFAISR